MRVLLSTIGSRGEVQPVTALALQLKATGQEVRVCAPPDFHDWIEGLGDRAIISRGWADLALADDGADCISIGETNHRALFGRVAAIVHHGGAGTTTTAARAGASQVVLPQQYDQHYWAGRVDQLGIGVAHPQRMPTADSLTAALSRALEPDFADRARSLATAIRSDGTRTAARHLMDTVRGS